MASGKYTYSFIGVSGSRYLGGIFRFNSEPGRMRALAKVVEDIKRNDVQKKDVRVHLYSGKEIISTYQGQDLSLLPGLEG